MGVVETLEGRKEKVRGKSVCTLPFIRNLQEYPLTRIIWAVPFRANMHPAPSLHGV